MLVHTDEKLQDLYEKRLNWSETTKEMGFDIHNLLANLYSDESHFIFELLQNAEDVAATKAIVRLYPDHLSFSHNAEKKFSFDDVRAITAVGVSTKKNETNKIGKFGLGIKSIFSLCEHFDIHSGIYNLRIFDFVVPAPLAEEPESGTRFELWYKDPGSYDKIYQSLLRLPVHLLLFLNHLKHLEIWIGDELIISRNTVNINECEVKIQTETGDFFYRLYSEDRPDFVAKLAYQMQGTMIVGQKAAKFCDSRAAFKLRMPEFAK